MKDFIKNPLTRNARAFLPLNISAVGSVLSDRSGHILHINRNPINSQVVNQSKDQYAIINLYCKRANGTIKVQQVFFSLRDYIYGVGLTACRFVLLPFELLSFLVSQNGNIFILKFILFTY